MPKLWKENRTDQEWELSVGGIADLFMDSEFNQACYLESMQLERVVRLFLTDKNGLNSVFDEEDYEEIHEAIRNRVFPDKP